MRRRKIGFVNEQIQCAFSDPFFVKNSFHNVCNAMDFIVCEVL